MTAEEQAIFDRMSGNIPDEYEKKTAGFWTYDFLASSAKETALIRAVVQAVADKLNVDNLVGDELTRECQYRRGIFRKVAKAADVILKITGVGTVQTGDLFATENKLEFAATETKEINGTGIINAQCTQTGIIGMVGANSITQMPVTITGITAVTNEAASYEGYEEETDASLRARYDDDVKKPATSNNIYHYQKWAKEVSGVGNARIFPTWDINNGRDGDNSVKVVIINQDMQPASVQLVQDVQTYIDPLLEWGKGKGESAISSFCTVAAATAKLCNVYSTISKSDNYTIEEISANINTSIVDYLKEIAFSETIDYVSYAKIAALIVSVEGVLDIGTFTLNEANENVILGEEEVAILGTFSIEVA